MSEEYITVNVIYPIGSTSKENPTLIYPVNFGYAVNVFNEYNEQQEVYLLGVDVPVREYSAVVIAKIHRIGEQKTLLVAAPENIHYNRQQIEEMINFNEKYYDYTIEIINDEIWDAYDENENYLGYDIPRSMAKLLPDGVYHVVVMIYTMTDKGRVLVTQRTKNKTNPLKWEVTGGSILKGETPKIGAIRELCEETGIKKSEGDLKQLYSLVDHERHAIYHGFMSVIPDDTHICLQEGETMDYKFIPYDEFIEFVKSDRFVPSEKRRFIENEYTINRILSQQTG